jgi:hypothetical protein
LSRDTTWPLQPLQASHAEVTSAVCKTGCFCTSRTSLLFRLRFYPVVHIKHLARSAYITGCFTDFDFRLMIRPLCKLAMRVSCGRVRSRHSLSCVGIKKRWSETKLDRFCSGFALLSSCSVALDVAFVFRFTATVMQDSY